MSDNRELAQWLWHGGGRHPARWRAAILALGAGLIVTTAMISTFAHSAELDTDGRGKFTRNAVLLSGPCWIAMNSAALLDLRWQCTYWGTNQ
jgi:hypothetical protein